MALNNFQCYSALFQIWHCLTHPPMIGNLVLAIRLRVENCFPICTVVKGRQWTQVEFPSTSAPEFCASEFSADRLEDMVSCSKAVAAKSQARLSMLLVECSCLWWCPIFCSDFTQNALRKSRQRSITWGWVAGNETNLWANSCDYVHIYMDAYIYIHADIYVYIYVYVYIYICAYGCLSCY